MYEDAVFRRVPGQAIPPLQSFELGSGERSAGFNFHRVELGCLLNQQVDIMTGLVAPEADRRLPAAMSESLHHFGDDVIFE